MTFLVVFTLLASQEVSTPPVVVAVTPPQDVTLVAGSKAEVRLTVKVKEGFHVQANPASEPYLVPLRLEMESDSRVRAAKTHYPPGKPIRLVGAEKDLSTYEGAFELRLELEASVEARPGEVTLKGALHYQACDDRVCLRPASVPVSLAVKLLARR